MECVELCERISAAFLSDKVEWNTALYDSLKHSLIHLQRKVSEISQTLRNEEIASIANDSTVYAQHLRTKETKKQYPALLEMLLFILQKLLLCMSSQMEANDSDCDRNIGLRSSFTSRQNAILEIAFDILKVTLNALYDILERDLEISVQRLPKKHFSALQQKSLSIIQR